MPDVIGWFAEQVRKQCAAEVDVWIDAGEDGVHHVTAAAASGAPPLATAPERLVSRFRARADGSGGLIPTAVLTIGPVARVGELLGTTVIDQAAMRRLAQHQLEQAFPTQPAPGRLETVGLFDPTIGRGWVIRAD